MYLVCVNVVMHMLWCTCGSQRSMSGVVVTLLKIVAYDAHWITGP